MQNASRIRFRSCLVLFQNDRGRHFLAPHRMRHAESHRFGDGRMIQQTFINLAGPDLFSAAIDQFFDAPGKREVAVGIEEALIAGAKPARPSRSSRSLRDCSRSPKPRSDP